MQREHEHWNRQGRGVPTESRSQTAASPLEDTRARHWSRNRGMSTVHMGRLASTCASHSTAYLALRDPSLHPTPASTAQHPTFWVSFMSWDSYGGAGLPSFIHGMRVFCSRLQKILACGFDSLRCHSRGPWTCVSWVDTTARVPACCFSASGQGLRRALPSKNVYADCRISYSTGLPWRFHVTLLTLQPCAQLQRFCRCSMQNTAQP